MAAELGLILGMAAVTLVPRVLPAVLPAGWRPPRLVERWLDSVPYAALGALIFPGILRADPDSLGTGAIAAAVALAVALARAPAVLAALAAVAAASLWMALR